MALDDDVAVLESVPLLAQLGEDALRILAIGAETQRVPHGAVLFYEGDLADSGYVVQQGGFLIERDRRQRDDDVTVGNGTLLAELALLTDTVHAYTATATSSSVVVRIPRSLFLKMLEGYPAAAEKLRTAMAKRIDLFTQDIVALAATLDPSRAR